MSKTIDEPLLPKETDSVLINRYIDQFEAYQVQAYKSTRHLRCYLFFHLGTALSLHLYLIVTGGDTLSAFQFLLYGPHVLWAVAIVLYGRSFCIKDPHLLHELSSVTVYHWKIAIFQFYSAYLLVVFATFIVLHLQLGNLGLVLVGVDLLVWLLSRRALLQTQSLLLKLKGTVASMRAKQNFYLAEYTFGEMKEPLEMELEDNQKEQCMFNPTSGQLFNSTLYNPKPQVKLDYQGDRFPEHRIYSH